MGRPLLGASASEIGIDRGDREPIQQQIARQLRALVLSGRLKPQQFISHRMALSDGAHAYALFNDRRDGAMKMVLTC